MEHSRNDSHAFGRVRAKVVGSLGNNADTEFAAMPLRSDRLDSAVKVRIVLNWHDDDVVGYCQDYDDQDKAQQNPDHLLSVLGGQVKHLVFGVRIGSGVNA